MLRRIRMQDYSLFAKRLYQERKKNKLTQKELAQKMGVSQGAISRIEKGLLIPSLDMFIQLSNTLNCSPNCLLQDYTSFSDPIDDYIELINLLLRIPSEKINEVKTLFIELLNND